MILGLFHIVYRFAWTLLLPLVVIYLKRRGRKDALYGQHIAERFGFYRQPLPQDAVWLHAVSLGETRSAIGLIRLLLERGDKVVVTNFTPAGRREAQRQLADAIAAGTLAVVWVPFDMRWTYRRFFAACRPKIGLTLEVEVWPAMIATAKRAGVPLYMCNGQYGSRPLARDSRGLRIRQKLIASMAGAFVKSNLQAKRFEQVGLSSVMVTGELRFDQPIPQAQLDQGRTLRRGALKPWDHVIAIASGVEAEEALYLEVIQTVRAQAMVSGQRPPLFIYVPRAPERFEAVSQGLEDAGLNVLRRSTWLDADLGSHGLALSGEEAVILGDSLGEMYFFLSLAERVVVGAGFIPAGAHNIIEPLALKKPVLVGPHVWTIEYPFVEAKAAQIVTMVQSGAELAEQLAKPVADTTAQIDQFLEEHSGASVRTLAAIDTVLNSAALSR